MEKVADGVWLLRGDVRRVMNIYFLEDGDGVTQFDGGTKRMAKAAKAAAESLGGLTRIVLSHAHPDHRGAIPALDADVFCHPDEVADAEDDAPISPYMDFSKLALGPRLFYSFATRRWDGGAVKIAGTLVEGDEVAGFRVIEFPGHSPGQIGLWRESDRLALVSDVIYLSDTLGRRRVPKGEATVPHPSVTWDSSKASESVRKLAALEPAVVGAGHDGPLRGENLRAPLERAAEKY
jgi:hydroxyacylglutathione hydrolase